MGQTTTPIDDLQAVSQIVIDGTTLNAERGWVVLSSSGKSEYIYDGTYWHQFGYTEGLANELAGVVTRVTNLESVISGGVTFKGQTTTQLDDGISTNPIVINDQTVTAKQGWLVYDSSRREFVFDGTYWIELGGDLSGLRALAWKDSASGSFTPAGSVSQPTFTGKSTTSTGKFTPAGTIGLNTTNKTAEVSKAASGTATYTPEGTVAAPTISVKTAGATTTVNSITAVGTLPSMTTTVANETLTIGFDAGTLPTKGGNTTVKTGDAAYQASAPAFTGTGARLVTGNIAVPTSASFTGTEGNVSVSGTPTGTVSKPTFTGTAGTVTVS